MTAEKRDRLRKSISTQVHINEKTTSYNAMSADVSTKGIALFTDQEDIQPGQTYQLTFDLPIHGKFLHVQAEAKIVHSIAHGTYGYRIGCEFTQIDTLSSWTVESFMNSPTNTHPSATSAWPQLFNPQFHKRDI